MWLMTHITPETKHTIRGSRCYAMTPLSLLSRHRHDRFPAKTTQGKAAVAADKKDAEEPADGLDVYLTLINGVVGRNKELKYDNGALQYFFGVPPTFGDYAKDASAQGYSGQVSGALCASGCNGGCVDTVVAMR
jgi:hypothetical protein